MKQLFKSTVVRFLFSLLCIPGLSVVLLNTSIAAEPGTETHSSKKMADVYAEYAVSEAVRAGDLLYIGGIVAIDEDGNVISPNDGKTQVKVVYDRIKKLLAAHGATAKNVISETIYVTDWLRYYDGFTARKQFYDEVGAAYPTAVGIEVVALADPGWVLEVMVVAYLG